MALTPISALFQELADHRFDGAAGPMGLMNQG
jgi:hypothetical protein